MGSSDGPDAVVVSRGEAGRGGGISEPGSTGPTERCTSAGTARRGAPRPGRRVAAGGGGEEVGRSLVGPTACGATGDGASGRSGAGHSSPTSGACGGGG